MGRVAATGFWEISRKFQVTNCHVWIGFIRAVKAVIIGQLLISIVGIGALFELYSANFLMKHF
jgi:hypothetical protein